MSTGNELVTLKQVNDYYKDLRGRQEAIVKSYEQLVFPVNKGTLCIYGGSTYISKQDINNSEPWTSSHWTETNISEELTDVKNELTNSVKSIINGEISLITNEYPGYYAVTGAIRNQSPTNKECYTNKIAVTPGEKIKITLDIASSNTMWIAVAEFASDQTFEARASVDSTTVDTTVTKTYTVRSDVYYISIIYRTYGDHSIIATRPWAWHNSINKDIFALKIPSRDYVDKFLQADVYGYERTVESGESVSASVPCFSVSIPVGTKYSFILYGDNGVIPNSAYRFYINKTYVGFTIPVNTEKTMIAEEAISTLSVYFIASRSGSFGCTLKVFNSVGMSAQDKLISISDRAHENALVPADLEIGAIEDGTGKDKNGQYKVRTKVYIPVNKGQHIKCTKNMNVYEYSLADKTYITDNNGWTTNYTVQNDCYVRILFQNNNGETYAQLISRLEIVSLTINNALIDPEYIASVSNAQFNQSDFASATVRSIAHRGDDIYAPQCTAPAYIAARKRGIEIMENDLNLSEDGEFVMWHDTTLSRLGNLVDINGYAMYTDGTDYYWVDGETVYTYDYEDEEYEESAVSLEGLTRCAGSDYGVNSTYDVIGLNLNVLKRLDFGVYKGTQFAGTQILTFEEWVLLCKRLGAGCYVDKKLSYTDELITQAASIVKKYGMGGHTSWLGLSVSQIEHLRTIIPGARCGVLSHPNSTNIVAYASVNNGNFFFNGDAKNGMTAEAIQLGLNAGYDVEVWYVDYSTATEEQVLTVLRNAISYGVTGITTDHYRASDAYRYLLD